MKKGAGVAPMFSALFTKVQGLDYIPVSLDIGRLEVVKETTSLTYQFKKRTLGSEIFLIVFQVVCKMSDTV